MLFGQGAVARQRKDLALAFMLLSRIPMPRLSGEARMADALRFAPVVGAAVAFLQAAVLFLCAQSRCPVLASAVLALAAGVCLTGAMHEDGLADVADSFGGVDRERKLAIMRDSRIGTFGTLALVMSALIRASALAHLLDTRGIGAASGALFIAAALSRALMLIPLAALPAARSDGLARSVGAPNLVGVLTAVGLAAAVSGAAAHLSQTISTTLVLAALLAAAGSALVTMWSRRTLGGVTGDVVGACQQVTEIVLILTLASGR